MNDRKLFSQILARVLTLVLLAGLTLSSAPQARAESAEPAPGEEHETVTVTNVDELLAAIAPDTTILLKAGTYDLSTAANYGKESHSPWYRWEKVWSPTGANEAELVIAVVDGLTIQGEGMEETTIAAVPRYENVIHFIGCNDLKVSSLTAGHTTEPGYCSGGVVYLENCSGVTVEQCGLFGCGTVGVDALETVDLSVIGCHIYECSYEAVNLQSCHNVHVEDCEVDHIRSDDGYLPLAVFSAYYSSGLVMQGNRIHDNSLQFLLQLGYTRDALFLTDEVQGNRLASAVFQFDQYGATVDGCTFRDNGTIPDWVQSSGVYASDMNGRLLDDSDFESMELSELDPAAAVTPEPPAAAAEVKPGGSITVSTVDEFLAAIGPDRIINLEGELFDLSSASGYGAFGGEYYFWEDCYDGPQLVIRNVSNLTICSASSDSSHTTLAAIPRYANVLSFRDCDHIQLIGITAGHTKEPGSCAGGVLDFQACSRIEVNSMRLFGCGILGIQASGCSSLAILNTEIYECSQGAASFRETDGIIFRDCEIHHVPSPALVFSECGDKTWNGEPIPGFSGMYDVNGLKTLS